MGIPADSPVKNFFAGGKEEITRIRIQGLA